MSKPKQKRPARATLQIEDPLRARLKKAAAEEMRTVANMAEVAIKHYLDQRDQQKASA